jgi:hypothetical protein
MNGFHIFTALLAIFVSSSYYSHSQWVQTNVAAGGNIRSIAVRGSDVLVGTGNYFGRGNGVLLSTNNGQSWTQFGLQGQFVSALAVSGGTILAGLGDYFYGYHGVYRSTDNGQSWAQAGLDGISVKSFAVSGSDVFAATNAGVYRSEHNGQTWTVLGTFPTASVALSNSRIFAGTYNGILVSTDNGQTWTPSGLSSHSVYSLLTRDSSIFAGVSNGGVYRSTNMGQSWTQTALDNGHVYSLTTSGSTLVAGTYSRGIYLSTNNGETWMQTQPYDEYVTSLASSGSTIFAGTFSYQGGSGVFLSTNSGQSWTPTTGLDLANVRSFATTGAGVWAGTNHGVFQTGNAGQTWSLSGLGEHSISSLAVSGSYIFACDVHCDECCGGSVYRSSNKGQTWEQTPIGTISSFAISGSIIYAGGGNCCEGDCWGYVYRSTDNGATWTATWTLDIPVTSLVASGTSIFAGTWQGVYRSTDNGLSWKQTNLSVSVSSLAAHTTIIYATGAVGADTSRVYKSTDNGDSWILTSLTDRQVSSLATSGSNVFAGTSNGVFASTDQGETWIQRNEGMGNLYVNTLLVAGDYLFAATSANSVWRRSLSELVTSVEGQLSALPTQFKLEQNYPNPFNPSTVIRFSIPVGTYGHTSLRVYDVLGREVATLVNEVKQPGSYEVTWGASGFASGVYLCRMTTGQFTSIRRMLLIK